MLLVVLAPLVELPVELLELLELLDPLLLPLELDVLELDVVEPLLPGAVEVDEAPAIKNIDKIEKNDCSMTRTTRQRSQVCLSKGSLRHRTSSSFSNWSSERQNDMHGVEPKSYRTRPFVESELLRAGRGKSLEYNYRRQPGIEQRYRRKLCLSLQKHEAL